MSSRSMLINGGRDVRTVPTLVSVFVPCSSFWWCFSLWLVFGSVVNYIWSKYLQSAWLRPYLSGWACIGNQRQHQWGVGSVRTAQRGSCMKLAEGSGLGDEERRGDFFCRKMNVIVRFFERKPTGDDSMFVEGQQAIDYTLSAYYWLQSNFPW
ncbi:unnamed protein product, partial [Ectocarpus sp. 12 AP-2014]